MSYLKINPDIFIGSEEFNRFKKFLDDSGFRKLFLQDSMSFGIINNSKAGNFSNFRIEQGTNAGTIKNADGIAIDKNGAMITRAATDNMAVPDDNQWYWVKIKHQYSPIEVGTVTVDINGNLTGTGTEFTKILRGQPNNPSRIRFSGSTLNTGEYTVIEVINDASAIISGDLVAESGAKLVVVGSFTPDAVVPSGSKDIFQYDSCLMTLVLETVLNTPPTLLADEEFVIARVRRNGVVLNIEDKRYAWYKSRADYELTKLAGATNPLIGIEAIKFDNIHMPREANLVYMAWTFRSTNWTIDASANRLTIIAGQGGKFKDTTYFTDNDFNGWRVYAKNAAGQSTWSHYATVKASSKSGSQINLILDHLDPNSYVDTTQEIIVAPDADAIEVIFSPDPADATELTTERFFAKINEGVVRFPVKVYKSPSCSYNVKYRLSTFGDYRKPIAIPSDTVSGYLIESNFTAAGVQSGSTRQTYTSHDSNGFITLTMASNAYSNRIGSVETGDLYGVEHLILNNASPVVDFLVGTRKQYQVVETKDVVDGGQGDPFVMSVDHYINLKKDGVTLRGGNSFVFQFKGEYTAGGFDIIFTQDYINSGSPGTILYTLTAADLSQSADDTLLFTCYYDDILAKWVVYKQGMGGVSVFSGAGLSGGGALNVDRTLAVNVDGVTIDITAEFIGTPVPDALRVKPAGIGDTHLAEARVKSVGVQLIQKVITFTGWDMDTNATFNVAHGLTANQIVGVQVFLTDGTPHYPLMRMGGPANGDLQGCVDQITDTNIVLQRLTGGAFDGAIFNNAGGSVLVTYTP